MNVPNVPPTGPGKSPQNGPPKGTMGEPQIVRRKVPPSDSQEVQSGVPTKIPPMQSNSTPQAVSPQSVRKDRLKEIVKSRYFIDPAIVAGILVGINVPDWLGLNDENRRLQEASEKAT